MKRESDMPRLDPRNLRRRDVLGGLAGLGAAALAPGFARAGEPLTLRNIPASPSAVFARAVTSPALQAAAAGVAFDVWNSTDQMRA